MTPRIWDLNLIKKRREKNNQRRSQFSKKRAGGVLQGMIMITDSMVFFTPSLMVIRIPLLSTEHQSLLKVEQEVGPRNVPYL